MASTRDAYNLLLKYAGKVAVVQVMAALVMRLGRLCVVLVASLVMFLMLQGEDRSGRYSRIVGCNVY